LNSFRDLGGKKMSSKDMNEPERVEKKWKTFMKKNMEKVN
jgi:hypothetical protein